MRVKISTFLIIATISISCTDDIPKDHTLLKVRQLIDTVGFTQYKWQLDSVIKRIEIKDKLINNDIYKTVICPHDDYTYAAGLYNKTLSGIKAKTVVLIGVAHKARNFNLENKLVFGSFSHWKSANGTLKVSPLREELMNNISEDIFIVHDSMMQLEHSLEAINPFLQRNKASVEIIPILVPYMTFDNMKHFASELALSMKKIMHKKKLSYGKDLAVVISNDAIHYGDEGWGGNNMARFGVDSLGTEKARQLDLKIIDECLQGKLDSNKIRQFNAFTIQEDDYKAYKWTWCGRYSVPFGLLFANKLNLLIENRPLTGSLVDYRTTIHNPHIKVKDIGMGTTAPAYQRHWVAFTGITYQ